LEGDDTELIDNLPEWKKLNEFPTKTFAELVVSDDGDDRPIQHLVKKQQKKHEFRWNSESHLIDAIWNADNVKSMVNVIKM